MTRGSRPRARFIGLVARTDLRLPTFEVQSMRLLKRLTMIVRDGRVEHVFYPVFPPNLNAQHVVEWLVAHAVPSSSM